LEQGTHSVRAGRVRGKEHHRNVRLNDASCELRPEAIAAADWRQIVQSATDTEALDELPAATLEEVTDEVRGHDFQTHPRRCRRLASAVADDFGADALSRMAEEYETNAPDLLGHQRFAYSDHDGHGIHQSRPHGIGVDGPDTIAGCQV
jgi:hypothetical protein